MKQKPQSKQTRSGVVEKRLQLQLEEVDQQAASGEMRLAHASLEDLYRRYPEHPGILSRLLNTSYEIGDHERYQDVCENLLAILPTGVVP